MPLGDRRGWVFALAVLLFGCAEGFTPPSKLESLRVLAVQPEPASGVPGEPVKLTMLFHDGRSEPDEVPPAPEVLWIGGCHNPPSRQYFGCYAAIDAMVRQLSDAGGDADAPPPFTPVPGLLGMGPEFEFPVPEGMLEEAPRYDSDPIHFGVSYVFFAVCAGKLQLDPKSKGTLPLSCLDVDTGRRLGTDDYVEGFTTVYTYEGSLNHNPSLENIEFAGAPVSLGACESDADCGELASDLSGFKSYGCSATGQCIPMVTRCDGDDSCPEYPIESFATRESAEPDPSAPEAGQGEILWLNFFADAGEFSADTRLLNDRETGWVDNHTNGWRPIQKTPGSARLFVTLNDNRGGADWQRFEVLLRDP